MRKYVAATLLTLLASMLLVIESASPAAAVKGCYEGRVKDYGENWVEDIVYAIPATEPWNTFKTIRLTGTLIYWFCPNGPYPWKIKPKGIDWCWTIPGYNNETLLFNGVTFNAYIYDNAGVKDNPAAKYVEDNGRLQNCVYQNIDSSVESWHYVSEKPKWKVRSTIHLKLAPDVVTDWDKKNGAEYHYINPVDDVELSGWHD